MKGFRTRSLAAGVAIALAGAHGAQAGIASGSLSVSVTVESGCTIRDSALEFETYITGQSSDIVAQTDVVVENCPIGNLTLHVDGGSSGNTSKRQMVGESGEKLAYRLYQDPNFNKPLGEGKQALKASLGTSSSVAFTIYGVVPGGQLVSPGVYTDSVQLTLDF